MSVFSETLKNPSNRILSVGLAAFAIAGGGAGIKLSNSLAQETLNPKVNTVAETSNHHAKAKKNICRAGDLAISLLGKTNTTTTNNKYEMVVKDCKTNVPTAKKNLVIEEIGIDNQKKIWHVKKLKDGQSIKKNFNIVFPPSQLNEETITLKAINRRKHTLAKEKVELHYNNSASSTVVNNGSFPSHPPQGSIELISGPTTNLQLDTPYTYEIGINVNETYIGATVDMEVASANDKVYSERANLIANTPWEESITTSFVDSCNPQLGIVLTATDAPPNPNQINGNLYFQVKYPVTFDPSDAPCKQ